jgi:polar amino acid transport system substrate-binding protein
MKTTLKSLASVVAMAAFFGSAWAADPVLVNVDAENPPFMSAVGGKASGVYPAVISAAFAKFNQPVSIEAKPWKRALAEIDEAKGGVGGIYKNDERAAKYDFSEPILTENTAVYFDKAKPIDFKTVADLHGKKVGIIRGWSYGDAFDAAKKDGKLTVEEVPNDKSNFLKLAEGRLDAVLAIEEAGKAIVAAEKLASIDQGKAFLASNKAHLAFNKSAKQTDLLAKFSKAIGEMKQDGSLDKIVLKELSK